LRESKRNALRSEEHFDSFLKEKSAIPQNEHSLLRLHDNYNFLMKRHPDFDLHGDAIKINDPDRRAGSTEPPCPAPFCAIESCKACKWDVVNIMTSMIMCSVSKFISAPRLFCGQAHRLCRFYTVRELFTSGCNSRIASAHEDGRGSLNDLK
jgi:hypothetical protein